MVKMAINNKESVEKDNSENILLKMQQEINVLKKQLAEGRIGEEVIKAQVEKGFAYSIRLWEEEGEKYPIVSIKLGKNIVGSRDMTGKKRASDIQTYVLEYIKDGENKTVEIDIKELSRLPRSKKILAKRIQNLDELNTDVYISKEIHPDEKFEFYKLHPVTEILKVTLEYEGKDYTILSNNLNT